MTPARSLPEALTRLALAGRLYWREVYRLCQLGAEDAEAAVEAREWEAWFLGQPLIDARVRAIWEALGPDQ